MYDGMLLNYEKNETLPLAKMWVDLEGIILSEISQRKRDTVSSHLYVESKKYNEVVTMTKQWNKLVVTTGEEGTGLDRSRGV